MEDAGGGERESEWSIRKESSSLASSTTSRSRPPLPPRHRFPLCLPHKRSARANRRKLFSHTP